MTKTKQNKSSKIDLEETEEIENPAPDGGYAWVILICSFFVSFILDGLMYAWGVILQPIKLYYDSTNEKANLLSSLNTGFLFCSGPIVSGLANQFGCRAVVIGGGFITSLMYFLSIYAPTINVIMGTYGVIAGLSTGCTYIASIIVIAEYFNKKRGIATGITMAGSGVGSFVFAPVIQILIEKFDWKFTMSICACIIMQTCLCGALLKPLKPYSNSNTEKMKLKESKNKSKQAQNNESANVVETFSGSMCSINSNKKKDSDLPLYERNAFLRITIGILKEMTDFRLLVQNWGFLLITLSNFFLFTGYFTPFLFITKIAQDNNIQNAPFILSIIGIVNIPCRIFFGLMADKRYLSPINLNTISVAIATVPLFFYVLCQYHFWSQAIFAVVFAIGMAGFNSLTTMYLIDLVGLKKFSNATGIINLFRGFGCFLGPFLGGLIADKFSMITSFYFSGGCFVAGFILALLVSIGQKLCARKKDTI